MSTTPNVPVKISTTAIGSLANALELSFVNGTFTECGIVPFLTQPGVRASTTNTEVSPPAESRAA